MDPGPRDATAWLTGRLMKMIQDKHPDAVVVIKGTRQAWRKRYDDSDPVNIVTARDQAVCNMPRHGGA